MKYGEMPTSTRKTETPRHNRGLRGLPGTKGIYRSLYDGTPVMMHSIDHEGRLLGVNNHWLEVLGYDRSEVIGRPSTDFLTETSRRHAIEVDMPKFVKTGSARDIEYQMIKKSGEVIDVLLSATAQRDEADRVGYALAFIVDVTEQKRRQQEEREAAVRGERHRLARGMHDTLAQALSGVVIQLAVTEELLEEQPRAAKAEMRTTRELARQALEETRRSIWDLHQAPTGGGLLVESIGAEVARFNEGGFRVSLEVEGSQPQQMEPGNGLEALGIVQEALRNIQRHAQVEEGTVRLTFGPEEVTVLVSDHGTGFDPASVGDEPARAGGGFGLIAMRQRAELTGGALRVGSRPGGGTQVESTIPYRFDSRKAPALADGVNSPHLSGEAVPGGIRVMIVDDHDVVRRGLRTVLENPEDMIIVGEARDGEEALEKIPTVHPDVVLMNIHMSRLDGVETVTRMRDSGLETRVILLSAYAQDDQIFEGLRAGASGYLLKDVSSDDLVSAVRAVHRGEAVLDPAVFGRLIRRFVGTDHGLTKRELEVLQLLATGASNARIANELSVSVNTVKYHSGNVYRKLGARSRTQATRIARDRGLLDGLRP